MNAVFMFAAIPAFVWVFFAIVAFALFLIPVVFGAVMIHEREVGIVVKRWAAGELPPGSLIALNGEAGYQADTRPPGLHLWYFPFKYRIIKAPVTIVPQGEIALIMAADGASIPSGRILGRVVECDNFQDARKFLVNGGEKGRQLGILTSGTYRINTALFLVIGSATAEQHGMFPQELQLRHVEPDMVGIVTTNDGVPIEAGEIAGPVIAAHD